MTNNVVKMRAKKGAKIEAESELFKNPYLIAGAGLAIGLIIYYLMTRKDGPTTDGGTRVTGGLPSETGPVRSSMDMAVIPGARVN